MTTVGSGRHVGNHDVGFIGGGGAGDVFIADSSTTRGERSGRCGGAPDTVGSEG